MSTFNRREFITSAALLPIAAGTIAGFAGLTNPLSAIAADEPVKRVGGSRIKISLNAYSFTKLLNDQKRHRGPGISLFDVLEFCAKNDFDGFDPTGYFFPTYPGYFKTKDPYEDMALVAPYAVNWQIKQSPFGEESEVPTDLVRLVKTVRKSGYRGYLPIETLSPEDKAYDPYAIVPAFLKQLRDAIAQTA